MKRFSMSPLEASAPRTAAVSRLRGFTLIELLVVMAVVSLLVAILLPALSAARERAYLTQCSANLRQWGLAMIMYDEVYGAFPNVVQETYRMRLAKAGEPAVQVALRDEFGVAGDVAYCPNAPDRTVNGVNINLHAQWQAGSP